MNIQEPMESAVYDLPDERDYEYEALMGSDILPDKVDFPQITVVNQGLEKRTRMSCTRCGLGHIINAQNKINKGMETLDIFDFWERYLKINPNAEFEGATLQSALKQAEDEGLIGGFFKIKSDIGRNDAINRGFFIYTGSNNGDWGYVRKTGKYRLRTDKKTLGHCFCIPKHEGALNSYGPNNGYIDFPKEFYSTTFSQYAIAPKENYNLKILYKKQIMSGINIDKAKEAFEAGIWNGQEPTKPVSREECATMVMRALEKLQK